MSKVTVLVGLPGSGKSFHVNSLRFSDDQKVFVYSTDAYIEEKALLEGSTYSEVFEHYIREATDYMNNSLQQAIADNTMVIWDQTNMNPKKRKWILSQFPESYDKCCFTIAPPKNPTEWAMLYARLGARVGKTIPGYVLDSMLSSYEEPTLEEGFDLVYVFNITGNLINFTSKQAA